MENNYHELSYLGFSKMAIACYAVLDTHDLALASTLAKEMGISRTHVYQLLKALEMKGFVSSIKTELGPTYYGTELVENALDTLFVYQKQSVLPIIRAQRLRYPPK